MHYSLFRSIGRLWSSLADSSLAAYLTIAALQLKVMWWIWEYRDLVSGDTSYYYREVFTWLAEGKGNIVNSPIYTLFLAGLHSLSKDPFWVLIIAQIAIATSTSVLVLALLRRLLPWSVAWLIAIWWTLLPVNFDTIYSVHLFSTIFPLLIFLSALRADNIYGRGVVLGGLLLTSLLVRIEYSLLFLLWMFVLAGYELHLRRQKNSFSLRTYLVAYGLPVLAVVFLTGVFITRSPDGFWKSLEIKSQISFCQVYAYNKRQHGDWQGNPWTECQDLLQRDFGKEAIGLTQAFSLNPPAILKHIWWNIKLIPGGMQLALFNRYAGGDNPDYVKVKQSSAVWVPFFFVLGLSIFAVIRCSRAFFSRNRHPLAQVFTWLLMASTALFVLVIMLMQRPRPSYMFPLTLFIMALTGVGLQGLCKRLRMEGIVRAWWPLAVVLLVLLVPPYYNAEYINHFGYRGQSLREMYQRVEPYIHAPAVIVSRLGDYIDLGNYLDADHVALAGEKRVAPDRLPYEISTVADRSSGENIYLFYTEEMIDHFTIPLEYGGLSGYVQLSCFSQVGEMMSCSDGTIDLRRGVMNDGRVDIPLRAALVVQDGMVIDRKDYASDHGYYLQILMRKDDISRILVADEMLFRSYFNRRFLLGDYDRSFLEEVGNDFPLMRLLRVKRREEPGRQTQE